MQQLPQLRLTRPWCMARQHPAKAKPHHLPQRPLPQQRCSLHRSQHQTARCCASSWTLVAAARHPALSTPAMLVAQHTAVAAQVGMSTCSQVRAHSSTPSTHLAPALVAGSRVCQRSSPIHLSASSAWGMAQAQLLRPPQRPVSSTLQGPAAALAIPTLCQEGALSHEVPFACWNLTVLEQSGKQHTGNKSEHALICAPGFLACFQHSPGEHPNSYILCLFNANNCYCVPILQTIKCASVATVANAIQHPCTKTSKPSRTVTGSINCGIPPCALSGDQPSTHHSQGCCVHVPISIARCFPGV